MSELTVVENPGLPTLFKPEQTRMKLGALREGAKIAAKIRDWEALEAALDSIIGEQRAFTAWWDAKVTPRRNAKLLQGSEPVNAARHERELSVREATSQTGVTQPQVSKWRKRLANEESYREILRESAYAAMWAVLDNVRGTQGSGDNEWFTPTKELNLARLVLGEFDLDPASSPDAQKNVQAKKFFSKEDDGLQHEWRGTIWLNPPFERQLIAKFVSKLCAERIAGRITAAIMLTHNYTDTAWFHEAVTVADAICFTRSRVKFLEPDGNEAANPVQGQAFFYFGDDVAAFVAQFATVGFVVPCRVVPFGYASGSPTTRRRE